MHFHMSAQQFVNKGISQLKCLITHIPCLVFGYPYMHGLLPFLMRCADYFSELMLEHVSSKEMHI